MNKLNRFIIFLVIVLFAVSSAVGCFTTANPDDAENSKVIWLGDSIFHLTGAVADYLESDDMASETFRHYYISGADMTQGALPIDTIRDQYDRAMADNSDVRTVITDGGGNDVLISNLIGCSSSWRYHDGATTSEAEAQLGEGCKEMIDEVVDAFEDMIMDGKDRGITKALYVCVYYLGGIFETLDAVTKYGWDTAHLMIQQMNRDYGGSDLRVVFVDPRPHFLGKTGLRLIDGIHPTAAGSKIIAELMWNAMQDNCIEQGSGCVPSVPIDDGL